MPDNEIIKEVRGTITKVCNYSNVPQIIIQPDDKTEGTITEAGEGRDYSQFSVGQRVVHVVVMPGIYDELSYDQVMQPVKTINETVNETVKEVRGTITKVCNYPNVPQIIIQPDDKTEGTITEAVEGRDYSQFSVGQRIVYLKMSGLSLTCDELSYDQLMQSAKTK